MHFYLKVNLDRGTTIKFRALEKESTYLVKIDKNVIVKTGRYLMNHGLELKLYGDYDSIIIKISKIEE